MTTPRSPRRSLRRFATVLVALSLALLATSVTEVASPPVGNAAFPGANGKIAFYSVRDGNGEIYVMNADGSAQARLTNTPAGEVYPKWSPDGTKIAFMSNRDGNSEIYVMDADGTDQTRITNNVVDDDQPAWSPDGNMIVFTRQGFIWVMNADGSSETQLTSGPNDADPAWSPDGAKIAFHRFPPRDIFVMNANGSGQTNITNNGLFNRFPNWSPDGTRITVNAGPAGTSDIYVMYADGSGQAALTSDGVNGTPAWSPDGTKIVFSTFAGDIKVMNANGTGQTTLTSPPAGGGSSPDWQPLLNSFSGFFSPVDNLPAFNSVKAGAAIPVKFSLNGDQGLDIFAAGYPRSQKINCDTSAPLDAIEETVTAGASSLSYDPVADRYVYVWKTDKAWAGTCRQLIVRLADLTDHEASFKFR